MSSRAVKLKQEVVINNFTPHLNFHINKLWYGLNHLTACVFCHVPRSQMLDEIGYVGI